MNFIVVGTLARVPRRDPCACFYDEALPNPLTGSLLVSEHMKLFTEFLVSEHSFDPEGLLVMLLLPLPWGHEGLVVALWLPTSWGFEE